MKGQFGDREVFVNDDREVKSWAGTPLGALPAHAQFMMT